MFVYILIGLGLGTVLGVYVERTVFSKRSDSFHPFSKDEKEVLEEARAALRRRGENRLQIIMAAALQSPDGQITNDDVEDLFCISDRTASNYLRQLTEAGRLLRHGSGRGTYYTIAESRKTPAVLRV
jgi:Fic family protein